MTNIMTLVNYAPRRRPSRRSVIHPTPTVKQNPLVNIQEDDDGFEIHLAIPGISKDQIEMEVKDDQLIITAKTVDSKSPVAPNFHRKEYDFSTFEKIFNLHEDIDQNAIQAKLADGVLQITLIKKEEAKPIPARSIAIQ